MAAEPIEVELAEARRIVEPEKLEDVLEALRKNGFIAYFVICMKKILVWQNPDRRIDCALFSSDENEPRPGRGKNESKKK